MNRIEFRETDKTKLKMFSIKLVEKGGARKRQKKNKDRSMDWGDEDSDWGPDDFLH